MELIYFFLLFLWGKVDFTLTDGGADLEYKQATASPGSGNVPEQPCPSELQAQLREIRATLSELRTHTEKLNQLQAKVEQLQTQNQDQAAELKSLKTWINVTENHVDSLRRDRAVGRVAFSASLKGSGSGYTGPYDKHTTLVFRHVISNIGNAYNKQQGIFTAPVRGVYRFEFFFYVLSGSAGSLASLMKNSERVITAHEEQSSGFGSAGNAATLLLEAGDAVFVQIFQNYAMYDSMYHQSTFSGHLLFPI